MDVIEKDVADISAFADPFTQPKVRRITGKMRIDLLRNSRSLTYDIDPDSGKIDARHNNRKFINTNSLLASEEFSNLLRFAKTQVRAAVATAEVDPIPASILFDGNLIHAKDLIEKIEGQPDRIRLILLDGPAGVGKTFQVQNLVSTQANKYAAGIVTPPVLHVNSRGRRLSNLPDVLAASTQALAANFGADQIQILVRRGLLVVAIDGFDELVDAEGYADSWLALRRFLSDIGTGGTVVLAARDTFVAEQELLTRIARTRNEVNLSLAHIKAINPNDAKEWLAKSPHWKKSDIESEITDDILTDDSYALRPFFLRVLREAKGWSPVVAEGPRTFLANHFIKREAKLIAKQLVTSGDHDVVPPLVALFHEIALEMGIRESDSIEIDHLAFITQYCFENIIDGDSIRKIMHKAGSFAFLEQTGEKDRRKFPHSEIQYYFLLDGLMDEFANGTAPSLVRRSMLGAEHLEVLSEVMNGDGERSEKAAQFLRSLVSTELTNDCLAANCGAMLITAFSLGFMDRLDYLNVHEATMGGTSPKGVIGNSNIGRLDISDANIAGIKFEKTTIGTLIVSERTVFGSSYPNVKAMEIRLPNDALLKRSYDEMQEFFTSHTEAAVPGLTNDSPYVRLLDRVARKAVRQFYLREKGDEDMGSMLLREPEWAEVRKVLHRHKRIEVHSGKSMHGRPSALIRIKNPKELLDRTNPETFKILKDLIEIGG